MEATNLRDLLGEQLQLRWEISSLKREIAAVPNLEPLWKKMVRDWRRTETFCKRHQGEAIRLTLYPLHQTNEHNPIQLPVNLIPKEGQPDPYTAYMAYQRSHAEYHDAYIKAAALLKALEKKERTRKRCSRLIRSLRKNGPRKSIEVEAGQRVQLWLCADGIVDDKLEIWFRSPTGATVALTPVPLHKFLKHLRRVPHPKWPMRRAGLLVTDIYLATCTDGQLTATHITRWDDLKALKQELRK